MEEKNNAYEASRAQLLPDIARAVETASLFEELLPEIRNDTGRAFKSSHRGVRL